MIRVASHAAVVRQIYRQQPSEAESKTIVDGRLPNFVVHIDRRADVDRRGQASRDVVLLKLPDVAIWAEVNLASRLHTPR